MKIGFISLGCAKNLVDTELMLGILRENNMDITSDPAQADIIIVNTCAFITTAKEEAITTILSMAEYKKIGKCKSLIVTGCLAQRYTQEIFNEMPEIDALLGTGDWHKILEAISETLSGNRTIFVSSPENIYTSSSPRVITTPYFSAYVKIAEGCNNNCAFCAIPQIRGKYRSRRIEDILSEVNQLVISGVKEIILIAQDTTRYGYDIYNELSLSKLLKEMCKINADFWIRILYSYPRFFTDELIETIATEEKICKYVDLPLQHAHDSILKSMNRPDTKENIELLLSKIRQRIPNVTIRSTFIVGFPGETDSQYQTLKNFIEQQQFDKVGIFTYSKEEGTVAYTFKNQIAEDVIQERYHELMSIQCKISETINHKLEGKVLDVLVEGTLTEEKNVIFGRSHRESPEVDGQIYIENDNESKPGDIIKVRVIQGFTYDVVATKITNN